MKKQSLPILLSLLFVLLLSPIIPTYCFAEEQTEIAAIVAAKTFVETLDKSEFSAA